MIQGPDKEAVCQICKQKKPLSEVLPVEVLRKSMQETLRKTYPDYSPSGYICNDDLNRLRGECVQEILEEEKGPLSESEKDVVASLREQELVSVNADEKFESTLTFGERLADRVADFGGSWTFLIIFAVVLIIWILINGHFLLSRPFDPYPYIFLNLILSCLAAMQAPIIMMSQNRQEAKDRLRADHDYRVNLKAELEIQILSEKMDRLVSHQWQRLLEIQQIQTDLMEEFLLHHPRKK